MDLGVIHIKNLTSRLKGTLFSGLLPLDRSRFIPELIAGIVMAAIFIPEVMGYAKIAGMPIITGIYTIIIPMAVFVILGSSRHLIVGADSATAAIMFGILVTVAMPGSPVYTSMAFLVAFLCGILLVLAWVFKLGFIGDFLSRTALVGFLTGVGIQVSISQLGAMFGLTTTGIDSIPRILSFLSNLSQTNLYTLAISVGVLLVIIITGRINRKIPGALIAVAGTILLSFFYDFTQMGVSLVGSVPSGIPSLMVPSFQSLDFYVLFTTVMACFIVIIAQSVATSRAYSVKCSDELDENKDVLGLGLSNILAGLTGSFVVNGSPTKTQIAVDAGARSQLATLVTAAVVIVVVIFFTEPVSLLPNATLAAIVFLIGLEMVDITSLKAIYREMPAEFVLAIITFMTVVLAGVLWGVIVSVIISLILHLSHSYRPNNSILIRNEKGEWAYIPVILGVYTEEGLIVYRFNRDLYYANAEKLMKEVIKIVKNSDPPLEWLILDSGGFTGVDYTSVQMLKELKVKLDEMNVVLVMTTVFPSLRRQFERSGFMKILGKENLYGGVNDAINAFENRK
ncbi:SulP family inorganic anion transporter [Methanobacterium petrolearium]|uniref:SulP family inorganic anion transporter n=1 Tax=Methanobacterium petrolearium TaxID=710190 RepID=UPI00308195DF